MYDTQQIRIHTNKNHNQSLSNIYILQATFIYNVHKEDSGASCIVRIGCIASFLYKCFKYILKYIQTKYVLLEYKILNQN